MVSMYLLMGSSPQGANRAKSATILRIFRIFRLSRVARTARLLNSCPELMILARGMMVAVRSVVSILLLLLLVIYIFAIIFTQLLSAAEIGAGRFDSVLVSMNFLLLQVLCGFDVDFINAMLAAGFWYYATFLLFLLIASLTIMNMLIGILCDVVATVANVEKDEAFSRELDSQVTELAEMLDKSGSGTITHEEFDEVLSNPYLAQSLDDLGVDVVSISDYAAFIFSQCEELTYQDFLHMVSQFRGAKDATVKDMMDMRKCIAMELSYVKDSLDEHMNRVSWQRPQSTDSSQNRKQSI